MKKAILVFLVSACFSLACHQVSETVPPQLKVVETPVLPVPEADPALASAVSIQLAKVFTLERPENLQTRELRLPSLSLKKRLPPRAEVLLIPLSGELAPLRTQVMKVTSQENPCSSALPKLYETELRPVKEKSWLNAAAPFDVCVIYPVMVSARALRLDELQAGQLPKKVTLTNIIAALDTNNDQQPEALLVEYCCDKPEQDRKTCDLTCSAVYVRDANGQWRIVETQTPC